MSLAAIAAHHRDELIVGAAAADSPPRSSSVAGAEGERRVAVEAVRVDRDVGYAGVDWREIDRADDAPRRDVGGRDVTPVATAVCGALHQAVFGAHPDLGGVERRRGDA